jgi:hypothetical protein
MADRRHDTTNGYSFRFFSPEQVDEILRDGFKRGRVGSHAAIERILKHEPQLERAELWRRIRWLKTPRPAQKYRRTIWGADDETILRDGYRRGWQGKKEAVRELRRRHPGWCPHVIWRRAAKLGLVEQAKRRPVRNRHPWSEEDDRVLLSLAGYKRMRMIAKLLHRSERGVRYRLAVLGKSSRVQLEGYARRTLAEELHFGRRTIQRLIATGLLEVRDPRITPQSLDALRQSGRLSSLQQEPVAVEPVCATDSVKQITTPTDEDTHNSSDEMHDTLPKAGTASRAKRVWTEVAKELGVSFETVQSLILDRALKVFDPRITEQSLIKLCRRNGSLINWEFLDSETRDWLESTMDVNRRAGADTTMRLNPFRKHALVIRRCMRCGRAIRGNAFFAHSKCGKNTKSPYQPSGNPR